MNALSDAMVFMIPIVSVVAFFSFLIVASIMRARVRELEIRERIAMIEKGLMPSPEADPKGFDRAMARRDRVDDSEGRAEYRYSRANGTLRHRRAGTTLIGIGLGLMLMIGVAAGEPDAAIGVGGFVVMIGLAFLVNSFLEARPPSRDFRNGPKVPDMGAPKLD
jgi:hypothetical protein